MHTNLRHLGAVALCLSVAGHAAAHGPQKHQGGISTPADPAVRAEFDIVHTRVHLEGRTAVFHMGVSGQAGASHPTPTGQLAGGTVFSYVWPTSVDPATVGFEAKAGILALAVTSHPDFDDTPLFDENGDGNLGNDGDVWHAHWVVLQGDEASGIQAAHFDGVTAALRVNANVHSPLLCVAQVNKVASGTLSLPGRVGR